METAAQSGNSNAMVQLGLQLLSGKGDAYQPQKGADLLAEAARLGHAEACAFNAVFAGTGFCREQSWESALNDLQRSAELGWKPAQRQLALLANDPSHQADWQTLRRSIDIGAWLNPPPRQPVTESPRIRKIESFIPAAMCDWLIESARGRLKRARTYAETGEGVAADSRTNSEAEFTFADSDLILIVLRARMAAAAALPPGVLETTTVLHYAPGQQFSTHFDFIDPVTPGLAAEIEARGQRLITFLLYLNDDYEGGETDFPVAGVRHKGRKGDALLFSNVDRAGNPDRLTLHAGLAPTRGEKWLLSQWMRNRVPGAA